MDVQVAMKDGDRKARKARTTSEVSEARKLAELRQRSRKRDRIDDEPRSNLERTAMTGEVDSLGPMGEKGNELGQLRGVVRIHRNSEARETPLHQRKDGDLGFISRVAVIHFPLRSTWNVPI
jgi:hypothetical protein